MILRPNTDHILEHLCLLHDWIDEEHNFQITSVYPDNANPPKTDRYAGTIDGFHKAANDIVVRNKQGYNIYTMVNPVPAGLDRAANAEDIAQALFQFTDADKEVELKNSPLKPVCVVITGTIPFVRKHTYWRYQQPLSDLAKWSATQKRLIQYFDTDKAIHDPPRIMRVAGTVSHPDKKKKERGYAPELTELLIADDLKAYTPDDFDFLPALRDTHRKPQDTPQAGERPRANKDSDEPDVPLAVLLRAFEFIVPAPAGDVGRKKWLSMGFACFEANQTEGYQAWDAWSQLGGAYDSDDQRRTWNKMKPAGGVTRSSLFKEAYEANSSWWKDDGVVEQWRTGTTAAHQKQNAASLPGGFRMDENGLWFHPPPDKDGVVPDPICISDPFNIRYRVRNDKTGEYGTIVEFVARDGQDVERFVPDSLLHDMPGKLATHLAGYGLIIKTYKLCREKLQQFFNEVTAQNAVYVQHSGWVTNHEGTEVFVLPSGEVIGGEGVIMQPDRKAEYCEPAGTLQQWKDNVAKFAVGNSRVCFAIALAFAAPLMKHSNISNGGFHLYSEQSSTGKTTCAMTNASVIGKGTVQNGYIHSWRGTDNAQEAVIARVNDCSLILDEMGAARPEVVDQIIYMVGNGQGKSRLRTDASLRSNYSWRTLMFSTGEIKADDKIKQAGKNSVEGVGVRLANIPAVTGEHGVFENLHGMTSQDLAKQLSLASSRYYGTAIIGFLQNYIANPEAALRDVENRMRKFLSDNHLSDEVGQIGRVADRFALVAAAGELAATWNIVPWQAGEATEAATSCLMAWLDDREETGDDRIISMVRQYIGANEFSKFVQTGMISFASDIAGYKKAEHGKIDYYVIEDQMHKLVPGVNPKVVAKALNKAGYLVREKDRESLKYRLKPCVDHATTLLTYRVSGDIMEGND